MGLRKKKYVAKEGGCLSWETSKCKHIQRMTSTHSFLFPKGHVKSHLQPQNSTRNDETMRQDMGKTRRESPAVELLLCKVPHELKKKHFPFSDGTGLHRSSHPQGLIPTMKAGLLSRNTAHNPPTPPVSGAQICQLLFRAVSLQPWNTGKGAGFSTSMPWREKKSVHRRQREIWSPRLNISSVSLLSLLYSSFLRRVLFL